MFVLKIATTVWLTLIALGMTSATLNEKETVSSRLFGAAVRHGILIPAFVGSNPTCPVRGLLGSPTLDLVVPFTLIVESC